MSTTYTKIATMPWNWNDYGDWEASEEEMDKYEEYVQEELEKYGEHIFMDSRTDAVYNLVNEPKVEIDWDTVIDKAWDKLINYMDEERQKAEEIKQT